MRTGDTLVVWKLDRLARSLKQLIETVEAFGTRGIGLRSLTEAVDTGSAGGRLVFRKRFGHEQIAFALRQAEAGSSVEEVCRNLGISEPTFYR